MFEGLEKRSTERVRENEALRELKERMLDPLFLPTQKEIRNAFKTDDEWDEFCRSKENPVYEFLNEEFIEKFSNYLSERAEQLSPDRPVVVLEAGAGNGRLSHFLRERLEQKIPGRFQIIATDSGEWELKTLFPVEKLDHKSALEKYKPEVVIYSWMPYNEDMTKDFRVAESVHEYILIGETDGGCCGNNWETWGNSSDFFEDESEKEPAPYDADGFERTEVESVSDEQMCRTDDPRQGFWHSRTVSFRRK